ncbi:MAG: cupin domain-containing protein, partial [Chloroflexi bacterium]|nr:cupin domain-containing protein [Chloroflexota bacterium]
MKLETGLRIAGPTLRVEAMEIAPGEGWPAQRHPKSDAIFLFYEGSGEIQTADRVRRFESVRHAYAPAGTVYELRNTGDRPLKLVFGLCPDGATEPVARHHEPATPGGVTLLSIDQYDRFPDSGLVRGGMYFLE